MYGRRGVAASGASFQAAESGQTPRPPGSRHPAAMRIGGARLRVLPAGAFMA